MNKKLPSIFMVSCAILCKKDGMADYFRSRAKDFCLVTVTPKISQKTRSKCEVFHNGECVKSFILPQLPEWVSNINKYIIHIWYIILIFLATAKVHKKFNIFIGEGHIYSSAGLILKSFGLFKKTIYSSGDYFTDEKSFQVIDKFIVPKIDAIWNASEGMSEERSKRDKGDNRVLQFVMPLGVEMKDAVINRNNFSSQGVLFMGNVQEHQGLDLFLDVLKDVSKTNGNIKLHLIGTGPYLDNVKKKISELDLDKNVEMYGFIEDDAKVYEIASKCRFGIALYVPHLSKFTKFSDPGKIKDYISMGLPVVTTNVFQFSKQLELNKAGMVVEYEKAPLKDAVLSLLDTETCKRYSLNAANLARQYTWDKILDRVISETFDKWGKSYE